MPVEALGREADFVTAGFELVRAEDSAAGGISWLKKRERGLMKKQHPSE
jgi:hypothetical protein